jgi:hypothetical protein
VPADANPQAPANKQMMICDLFISLSSFCNQLTLGRAVYGASPSPWGAPGAPLVSEMFNIRKVGVVQTCFLDSSSDESVAFWDI